MDINAEWAPNQADPEETYEEMAVRAAAKGYTRSVVCDSDECTLEGWIKPDAELDGTFRLFEDDTGTILKVNGWLFTVEGR